MKKLEILIFLVTIPFTMFSPGKAETKKEFEKTWNVNSDTNVILINEYGKMDIKTWDKKMVDIKVVVTVKTKDKDDAQKVFDRIKINFSEGNGVVKAETEIEKKKSGYFDWFYSWSEDDYSIDWLVYMPKENNLNLKNKYGNTHMMEMDGDLNLEIKYGDLFLDKSNGDMALQLGYGHSKIDFFNNANLDIKYSELEMIKGQNLNADTKYSEIDIENVVNVVLNSKYDEFSLGIIDDLVLSTKYSEIDLNEVNAATIKAKYTDFDIKKLNEKALINSEYGSLEISWINSNFDEINIEGRYTGIELKLGEGANFEGNFTATYGDIQVPNHFTTISSDKKSNTKSIQGYLGSSNAKSSITIKSEYEDIEIK